MTKRSLLISTSLLLASAMSSAVARDDTYALKRVAKEGESAKYTISAKLTVGGMDVTATGSTTDTVKKFADDGYTVSSVSGDMEISFNGSTQTQPGGDETTTTYTSAGKVVKVETAQDQGNSYRLANLTLFVAPDKPAKAGDKWEFDADADKDKGTVKSHFTYEFTAVGKEGDHDVAQVKFKIEEKEGDTPASSEGTFSVDLKTGLMVKVAAKWKNAPIAGQVADGDFSLTLSK